ncbi:MULTISPECIES: SAM-dependent methyltransferase [unclassified Saccharopolyspora]|uniref:SAM-dependent methyltransferase n=1 Tax=unclassified Saccharopolyspora TaxID=2646250 RepID=UPI001CD4E8C4|nr:MULTISPECIES: SAM-dependent methyltransferase [unclassified Saccharopolyspora]MCA1185193.1 SAM-dependent methyltransferase [Saccharopolyspora sp. 6T]MCA1192570.1 SAM-dependent methyltransferase [Saccharopolyspora sp. 6V]MCA1225294.1 SAM-dependent methyltransferase [Saccharopolyspora sp. 6M]MCA1278914.1 SAM-dependent methyltransferase [Saccharopolyspora sp. 7B]
MGTRSDADGRRGLVGPGAPELPSMARVCDHLLGGTAHFELDREFAADLAPVLPNLPEHIRVLHAFLGRAVRHLAERGIDQFLDLGTGLPTVGDVHGTAQRVDPDARVAYVDADPFTVRLAEAQLAGARGVTVTRADLCEPASVLTAPGVTGLLDFTRPVAVLAMAALPFITDDDELSGVVAAYRDACSVGSALVVSHLSAVTATPEQVDRFGDVAARIGCRPAWRSADAFRGVFNGYDLAEPGLVQTARWRPELGVEGTGPGAQDVDTVSAVGLLVSRPVPTELALVR